MINATHQTRLVIKALVNGGGSTSESYAHRFLRADFSLFKDTDNVYEMWDYCEPSIKQEIVDTAIIGWGINPITVDEFIIAFHHRLISNLTYTLGCELSDKDPNRYRHDDNDELYSADKTELQAKATKMVLPLFCLSLTE